MNILSQFRSIKFFDVGKGNLAVFEGSNYIRNQKVTPTKIGVHACHMCSYLHEFFELILID